MRASSLIRPSRTTCVSSSSVRHSDAMTPPKRPISALASATDGIAGGAGERADEGRNCGMGSLPDFLLRQQRTVDLIGQADAAFLGEDLGVFVAQERAPDAGGAAAAERSLAVEAGEHVVEHRAEEYRLEIGRVGARLGFGVERRLGTS